ncbi:hypothetical protein CP967_01570 [Streptomyces nitrosporeus]|uniref:Uncharacterized protein n=1 Tax=Streptomyces nitrosporeus TaxID=28894 RepID=A0A5J6F6Z0_9ACTN|nr:hypothetical protein CP967_01570 [Streptomyces nitrosporeus]
MSRRSVPRRTRRGPRVFVQFSALGAGFARGAPRRAAGPGAPAAPPGPPPRTGPPPPAPVRPVPDHRGGFGRIPAPRSRRRACAARPSPGGCFSAGSAARRRSGCP